jgi:hypothetical protein
MLEHSIAPERKYFDSRQIYDTKKVVFPPENTPNLFGGPTLGAKFCHDNSLSGEFSNDAIIAPRKEPDQKDTPRGREIGWRILSRNPARVIAAFH